MTRIIATLSLIALCGSTLVNSVSVAGTYPAEVTVFAGRSADDFARVSIRSSTQELLLHLNPLKESIWGENAPIISFSSDVDLNEHSFRMEEVSSNFRVYHDAASGAVLGIDGNKVNGILGKSQTIKSFGDSHYIFDVEEGSYENDVRIPEYSSDVNAQSYPDFEPQTEPIPRQTGPYTVEILVVVDSVLAAKFTSDADLYKYLTIFWNGVNARYATISSPKYQIKIVGAVIIRKTTDEPFITSNIISGNQIKQVTLDSFSAWAETKYNAKALPAYDVVFLMTGRDMIDTDGSQGLAGIAWLGNACPSTGYKGSYYAAGMGEDMNAFYMGVHTATHEVAHNIGAPHDGDSTSGTGTCTWEQGYIMSYIAGSVNKLYFSPCSISKMLTYATSADGVCLSSINNVNPNTNLGTTNQLPGNVQTMDQTCQKQTSSSTATAADKSNCFQLKCKVPVSQYSWSIYSYSQPPPELSACTKTGGTAGVCRNGVCS